MVRWSSGFNWWEYEHYARQILVQDIQEGTLGTTISVNGGRKMDRMKYFEYLIRRGDRRVGSRNNAVDRDTIEVEVIGKPIAKMLYRHNKSRKEWTPQDPSECCGSVRYFPLKCYKCDRKCCTACKGFNGREDGSWVTYCRGCESEL